MKRLLLPLLSLSLLSFSIHALNYQHPILVDDNYVASSGNIITGNFQGTLQQPAITVTTSKPVTIQNAKLKGPGDLIYVNNGNVTVENTIGVGTYPANKNEYKGAFLRAEHPQNLSVTGCSIVNTGQGIVVDGFSGNGSASKTLYFMNNIFNNLDGRRSDGNGDYLTWNAKAAYAIKLKNILHVENIEIAWNQIINQPNQNTQSTVITIKNSSGTHENPILIHDNFLQGSYTKDGIAIQSAYLNIFNNQFVNSENHYFSMNAGADNDIYNNRVLFTKNSLVQMNEFSLWQKKLAMKQVVLGAQ